MAGRYKIHPQSSQEFPSISQQGHQESSRWRRKNTSQLISINHIHTHLLGTLVRQIGKKDQKGPLSTYSPTGFQRCPFVWKGGGYTIFWGRFGPCPCYHGFFRWFHAVVGDHPWHPTWAIWVEDTFGSNLRFQQFPTPWFLSKGFREEQIDRSP